MKMSRTDIKLIIRYLVIMYLLYLATKIIQPEWLNSVDYLSGTALSVLVGSVYGALGLVLKAHFKYGPNKDDKDEDNIIITKDIKIASRYLILFYMMYLITYVTSIEWLESVKDIKDTPMSVILGSVYGALIIVLGAHFEYKVDDTNINLPNVNSGNRY